MKVCTPHLGLNPSSNAGGEVYERELLRALAAQGVTLQIILARGKPYEPVPGWRVTALPVPPAWRKVASAVAFPPAIAGVYRAEGFDLLRAHSARYIGPLALWARRRYRLPVPVVTHHHHLDEGPWRPVERRVLGASDLVITVSRFSRDQLVRALGLDPARIAVVPNGIDERFAPGPRPAPLVRRWGLDRRRVIFTLGRLTARKNVEALLAIFRDLLAATRDDACLIVGGTGPELLALRARARAWGLAERVCFPGFIPEAEKVGYYNLADVFAFPSHLEGFGLAVGEAMACGKPVVAFRVGSLPEVVEDGVTGALVDPADHAGFARHLAGLLADETRRATWGAAGRARVDRLFRWPRAAAEVKAAYERVVAAARGAHA